MLETVEVTWPADAATAVERFGRGCEVAWLDSGGATKNPNVSTGDSLICASPLAVLEQFQEKPARLVVGGRVRTLDDGGWRLWRRVAAALPCVPRATGLAPGWVGYVGFEMAHQLERLPERHHEDLGLPLIRLALFDRGIVLDHRRRRALAVRVRGIRAALGCDGADADADWIERWNDAALSHGQVALPGPAHVRLEMDQPAYERMITRALDYIAAGDIYQVNLAQRLWLNGVGDPLATFAALRRVNPAPYAALLRWDDGAIASVSPELFLQLRSDRVLTRPIKGTRPRTCDDVLDDIRRSELLASEKEAAELAMIIDLHRNDLGRVCTYGSVQVTRPRRLETHPTVFHTVADIVGRLRPERDAIDLLTACFPAGSVTGVPKIRAMQIIDELEPAARGAYTGAIGVLGLDGQMTFNVAIRTLQIRGSAATLYVGGGIVADSEPAAEYEETLAKARGILSAVAGGAAEICDDRSDLARVGLHQRTPHAGR